MPFRVDIITRERETVSLSNAYSSAAFATARSWLDMGAKQVEVFYSDPAHPTPATVLGPIQRASAAPEAPVPAPEAPTPQTLGEALGDPALRRKAASQLEDLAIGVVAEGTIRHLSKLSTAERLQLYSAIATLTEEPLR